VIVNTQRQKSIGKALLNIGMSIHDDMDSINSRDVGEALFDYGAELMKGTMNGGSPAQPRHSDARITGRRSKVNGVGNTVDVVKVQAGGTHKAHTRKARSKGTRVVDRAPAHAGGRDIRRLRLVGKKPISAAAVRYGDSLWAYRKEYGLTQSEAAALVPFHPSTWSTMESGTGNPSADNADRLRVILTGTPEQAAAHLRESNLTWTSLNKPNN
jgi:hypothetical protein